MSNLSTFSMIAARGATTTDEVARLEADRVFVTNVIVENADRLRRIEARLADLTREAGELAEVRDLAGGEVVVKEEE